MVPKPYPLFAAAGQAAPVFVMLVFALARFRGRAAGQRQPGCVRVEESLFADHLGRPAAEAAAHDRHRMPMGAVRGAGPEYFLPHWGVLHICVRRIIFEGSPAAYRNKTQFW